MDLAYIVSIILLALGFGFVIFWHELGHFLAAKWAGVKVEQFAVGFGTAIFSWRKGIGIRSGSTRQEYEARARAYLRTSAQGNDASLATADAVTDEQKLDAAARALGLGETEYRLNWLPLGGYVKMLGQDDLNPNVQVTDPRAYNMQSIGKRMVIVSAGVIMNVFLAAVGFCVLFLMGFNSPPAIVGTLDPGSPAQAAGLEVGDRVLYVDGKYQHDFTKIFLNVALLEDGEPVTILYEKPDGTRVTKSIVPSRKGLAARGMLSLGIGQPYQLRGAAPDRVDADEQLKPNMVITSEAYAILPGDTIIEV